MSGHGGNIYEHPDILDFSANCNCHGMPEAVRQAAVSGVMQAQVYPDPDCTALRTAIGGYESVDPSWVLCGNGASELLLALAQALHPAGALLPVPAFSEYERVLTAAGSALTFFQTDQEHGFSLTEEFFSCMESSGAELLMLSNPNNPTGALYGREDMERLLACARRLHMTVVVDECFLEFVQEHERCSMIRRLSDYDRLIVVRAFTKTYACAGLRIGYLLCANEEILSACRRYLPTWNVSQPAACAGIAATGQRPWLTECVSYISAERERLCERLRALGFTVFSGAADYVFFHGENGLYEHCLSHGILIRDCSDYRGLGEGYYRVCVRLHEENERLLGVLSDRERGL